MIVTDISIVDDQGNTIVLIDKNGIRLRASNGGYLLLRAGIGTDANSVKLEALNAPLTATVVPVVDNVT